MFWIRANCLVGVLAFTACNPPPTGEKRLHHQWNYEFHLDSALTKMRVDVCFEGAPPQIFGPQIKAAWKGITSVQAVARNGTRELPDYNNNTDVLRTEECLRYNVDLRISETHRADWQDCTRYKDALLSSPDWWLWGSALPPSSPPTARFHLSGNKVAVPWTPTGPNTYRIPPTAYQWKSHALFGKIETVTFLAAGTQVRLATAAPKTFATTLPQRKQWIEKTIALVNAFFGAPIAKNVQVLIVPTKSDEVVFGTAAFGGGGSVTLMVGTQATQEALDTDWVATHELLHLGLPILGQQDAWFDEGLATYLEPVLRAQAGWITKEQAWNQLADGFERGRSQPQERTLQEDSKLMHQTKLYWRVYWAGALLHLKADVALGLRNQTLRNAVRFLNRCCTTPTQKWEVSELLEKLDQNGFPEIKKLANTWLPNKEFPVLTQKEKASWHKHLKPFLGDK